MFENVIQFHARVHPDRPAMIMPHRQVSYRTLDQDIQKIAARLREAIAPGAVVGVGLRGYYAHVLAGNAVVQLGGVTTSLAGRVGAETLKPDVVLRDSDDPRSSAPGAVSVDGAWLHDPAPAQRVRAGRPPSPDDPVQLLVTSGATGAPKRVLITRQMFDFRVMSFAMIRRMGPGARLLSLMGMDTSGGLVTPFQAWYVGGAVVTAKLALVDPEAPTRLMPNRLQASPAQLRAVLQQRPLGAPPIPGLMVFTGGAVVPPALVAELRGRLAAEVYILYGSTEAGALCCGRAEQLSGRRGAAGFLNPWTEARIVGPGGEDVSAAEVGEILVRTPYMPVGYVDDEARSARSFPGGWFRPGDLGSLSLDGVLTIAGRADDVVNLGGVKTNFEAIEKTAMDCPGVIDAGACALADADGVQRAFVAVSSGPGFDAPTLRRRLSDSAEGARIGVVVLDAIPRNGAGKILRGELTDLVRGVQGAG